MEPWLWKSYACSALPCPGQRPAAKTETDEQPAQTRRWATKAPLDDPDWSNLARGTPRDRFLAIDVGGPDMMAGAVLRARPRCAEQPWDPRPIKHAVHHPSFPGCDSLACRIFAAALSLVRAGMIFPSARTLARILLARSIKRFPWQEWQLSSRPHAAEGFWPG